MSIHPTFAEMFAQMADLGLLPEPVAPEPLEDEVCCEVCHEPLADECACQNEYSREHDSYGAER